MVTNDETFGDWLRRALDRRGWNARDLVEALGLEVRLSTHPDEYATARARALH